MRRWPLAFLALAVLTGCNTSRTTATGQPLGISDRATVYRIDYRVAERVSGHLRRSTERLWVRRPFESRLEVRDGRTLLRTEVARLGRTATLRQNAAALVVDQPPAVAAGDLRLAPVLAIAVHDGDVERRERKRVLGRVCQVHRNATRLALGSFAPPAKTRYVDSCIDARGLLLEEIEVQDGKRDVYRVATRVDLAPAISDELFAMGAATADVAHGGGSTKRTDPASSPPGPFWELDAPPVGFTLVGRFVVIPAQPENFTDPTRQGLRQAAVTDVYVRGIDAVFVERGGTVGGFNPFEPDPDNAGIDLGAIGRGEVVLGTRGVELRALTGGGHAVRVYGTLSRDDLAAVARALHTVPGNQLKLLE